MSGLLYKDCAVMKKDILLCGLAIVFFSIPLFLPWGTILENSDAVSDMVNEASMAYRIVPAVVYLFVFIVISELQRGIFAHDERKVWSAYITASPLGAKGQVLSKYFLTLAMSFAAVVWGYICDMISMLVSGTKGSAMVIYLSFFFVQIMLRAIELPFYFRFGHKHGGMVKLLTLAAIAFIGIVYLLFGKLPQFVSAEDGFAFALRLLDNEELLPAVVMGAVSLFPYAALLLYYGSYRLSCRCCQRGVDGYDV